MTAGGDLHERIVAQPVVVDGVLVSAGDCHGASGHDIEHLMQDAARVATVPHRRGEPPAHAEPALSLAQQQQARVRGRVAAVEIHCEFLAADGWQIEGKRHIDVHDGCGGAAAARGGSFVLTTIAYVNRGFLATAVTQNSRLVHNPG
jgi:hypothetical protein